ncbi:MAG: hypothetical protein ABIJ23_05290 [Candidatus Magasanikbacteria bacterium]
MKGAEAKNFYNPNKPDDEGTQLFDDFDLVTGETMAVDIGTAKTIETRPVNKEGGDKDNLKPPKIAKKEDHNNYDFRNLLSDLESGKTPPLIREIRSKDGKTPKTKLGKKKVEDGSYNPNAEIKILDNAPESPRRTELDVNLAQQEITKNIFEKNITLDSNAEKDTFDPRLALDMLVKARDLKMKEYSEMRTKFLETIQSARRQNRIVDKDRDFIDLYYNNLLAEFASEDIDSNQKGNENLPLAA